MNSMGDYQDLYLKTDVLLLADLLKNPLKIHRLLWIRSLPLF